MLKLRRGGKIHEVIMGLGTMSNQALDLKIRPV